MGEITTLAGPTFEEVVAASVMDAAAAAFDPVSERRGGVRRHEAIKTAASLVQFLKAIERNPGRPLCEWRIAIESLRIDLSEAA